MPLRRCVIRRRIDKSDRIGIETCYEFHCVAASSLDISGTDASIALYLDIAPTLSRQFFSCAKFK